MRRLPLLVLLLSSACGRAESGDDAPDANVVEPDAEEDGPDADPTEFSRVYAHSGQNLYRIDTADLDIILVGPFNTGGPSITDIAVDKDDVMIGVSLGKIWSIDPATGAATEIADFDGDDENLTSLSFVPLDPEDPDGVERLVAAGDQGNVYEVNTTTGATTLLGNYGLDGGVQIRSSGDIVSVRGVGTLATVTIGDTLVDDDFLATIDTTTWAATKVGTASTGYDKIFGLGYWGGTIFGFVDDSPGAQTGTMITIDPVTGVGTPAQSSAFRWFGAGVATDAPIVD
jgi:hypothetical protein